MWGVGCRAQGEGCRVTDYCLVDVLALRYTSTNFGAGKSLGEAGLGARIDSGDTTPCRHCVRVRLH